MSKKFLIIAVFLCTYSTVTNASIVGPQRHHPFCVEMLQPYMNESVFEACNECLKKEFPNLSPNAFPDETPGKPSPKDVVWECMSDKGAFGI